jgi:hypothetical protein
MPAQYKSFVMATLPETALAFAKECLNRPDAWITDDRVNVRPEFSLGTPGFLDADGFDFYDLERIMQMTTTWCRHHGLRLTLDYFDGSYTGTITTDEPIEIVEVVDRDPSFELFAPCVDACYVLLCACVEVRRNVRRISRHYESLDA